MAELRGITDIATARDAAEKAIDANPDPAQLFAGIGCVWVDARTAAQRRATAMIGLLRDETEPPADGQTGRMAAVEETWLNGLLVGLFLTELTAAALIDAAAFDAAMAAPVGAGQSFSSRLESLGLDPDAASEAAISVGITASRRDDDIADADWSAAQASAWLDGLIVALIARGGGR
jgi:hypothetical protein